MTFEQAPQKIALWLGSLTSDVIVLLLLINLFLIFVGLFVEMIAAMVILVHILVPVVAAGVDPVQFGIVMVMNLVIGALTPPLGVLVFTTARVGGAPSTQVFRAIVPFIAAQLIVPFLVTTIPQLTLLPIQLFGP